VGWNSCTKKKPSGPSHVELNRVAGGTNTGSESGDSRGTSYIVARQNLLNDWLFPPIPTNELTRSLLPTDEKNLRQLAEKQEQNRLLEEQKRLLRSPWLDLFRFVTWLDHFGFVIGVILIVFLVVGSLWVSLTKSSIAVMPADVTHPQPAPYRTNRYSMLSPESQEALDGIKVPEGHITLEEYNPLNFDPELKAQLEKSLRKDAAEDQKRKENEINP
jgi:hypothetical protein